LLLCLVKNSKILLGLTVVPILLHHELLVFIADLAFAFLILTVGSFLALHILLRHLLGEYVVLLGIVLTPVMSIINLFVSKLSIIGVGDVGHVLPTLREDLLGLCIVDDVYLVSDDQGGLPIGFASLIIQGYLILTIALKLSLGGTYTVGSAGSLICSGFPTNYYAAAWIDALSM
jgi:hypothetical protein